MKPSTFRISLSHMLKLSFGKPDIPSVDLKMLQNFLHLLLHVNGLNATVVNYQGEAADEMRALVPSSFESNYCEFDDNMTINVYKTTQSNCDKTNKVFEPIETPSLLQSVVISRKDVDINKCARQAGGGDIAEEVTQIHKRMSQIEDKVNVLNEHVVNFASQNDESKKDIADSNKIKETSYNQSVSTVPSHSTLKNESSDQIELDILGDVDCCKLRKDIRTITTAITDVRGDICDLREKIYEITKLRESDDDNENCNEKSVKECVVPSDNATEEKYLIIKQKPDSYKPTKCTDMICNIEASLKNEIECIDKRMQVFEDYVNCSLKNINEIISQNKSEEELIQYVKGLYCDLENIKANVAELKDSEEKQNIQLDAMTEEICLLKTLKADQQAVELSLAEKADACALAKKVSHEELEAVCDDLTRSLNEVIVKLSQQDSIWQQYLLDLRCEIEEKLDDLQIPALKDYINYQLQILKNQLKALSQIQPEQEAAGARKTLRNLRCLVCNKDAYINTNSKMTVGSEAFPCRKNMKPYLTFKMDQVRQQQKYIYQGKNMLHLEKITNRNGNKSRLAHEENEVNQLRDYLCDRYCGGSHTVITAEQKVKKSKTDITQWDADDLKLVEGFVKGTDGQIYRGRWVNKESRGNADQTALQEKNQAAVKV